MLSIAIQAVLFGAPLLVHAQTFKRLGTCPDLGCIFPPDQADFLPGQYFDIRLEVHAPVNGSEASSSGVPDSDFKFCIQQGDGECKQPGEVFGSNVTEPKLEKWNFMYFEDLFAKDAGSPTAVNVASKAWRAVRFNDSGPYTAKLTYNNGSSTIANWTVRESSKSAKAKNAIIFIGDGMTQNMITAARLIGHKSINGKYQSLMQLDTMDNLGHQMTHSIDTFITDSANSATALYTGHKSSVDALGVYADSSPNSFDDPKTETMFELFRRVRGGTIGMVSTAFIADATPAAMCSHTRDRDQYPPLIYEYLNGPQALNASIDWPTGCFGPDVVFGGGAEQFIKGNGSFNGSDMYAAYQDKGYNVLHTRTELNALDVSGGEKVLGMFCQSNMAKWLDRNVFPDNLKGHADSATGDGSDATDQPGLKDMTLKAIDILRARDEEGKGFFMMSEAASIDKMMHVLDYDRALGELLELDDTVRATIQHLKDIGEYEDTLIVVTADHGHGFDVFGGADTKYLAAQTTDRKKRDAVGTYEFSGLSGYQVAPGSLPSNNTPIVGAQGPNFPVQWNPRYAYAAGFAANPDHREGYTVNTTGPRLPATLGDDGGYVVNPADQPQGFTVEGTIPIDNNQGVHSLTDVPVFANGPGAEAFRGVYNSIDIFYKFADALALSS